MSNSPLVVYTRWSPNCTKPRNHAIDTISIHCMAGNLSIETCGNLFADPDRDASSNYGIGSDGRIGQYVDEAHRSWCTSSASNDHRAVTIEVANTAGAPDWPVSDKAYNALIDLCVDICKRNNIKKLLWHADKSLIGQVNLQNMTVHRWFAAKACPGDYLFNRHADIASKVNQRLEDDDMDQAKFNEMFLVAMNNYRQSLRDNDSSEYSAEARQWAIDNGLMFGNGTIASDGKPNMMWEDLLSREQNVVVDKRLYEFIMEQVKKLMGNG